MFNIFILFFLNIIFNSSIFDFGKHINLRSNLIFFIFLFTIGNSLNTIPSIVSLFKTLCSIM